MSSISGQEVADVPTIEEEADVGDERFGMGEFDRNMSDFEYPFKHHHYGDHFRDMSESDDGHWWEQPHWYDRLHKANDALFYIACGMIIICIVQWFLHRFTDGIWPEERR